MPDEMTAAEQEAMNAVINRHGTGTHYMFINGVEAGWLAHREYAADVILRPSATVGEDRQRVRVAVEMTEISDRAVRAERELERSQERERALREALNEAAAALDHAAGTLGSNGSHQNASFCREDARKARAAALAGQTEPQPLVASLKRSRRAVVLAPVRPDGTSASPGLARDNRVAPM